VFVSGSATILHADLDSFYASVEQRDDPALLGRPVAVGGGVVLAASYEAKAFGVRTPMGGREARRLCPDLITVPPRMQAYSDASKAVFAVFEDTAPLVEGISIDEAFLDVRGLGHISGTPIEIARNLRRRVREEVGLPITVGIARTKFLAKVASAVAKPDGLLLVEPDRELEFLHPLPVQALWGVGAKTAAKLREHGVVTVGQVAELGELTLCEMVGLASGRKLFALAHNRDPRPVKRPPRRRSIGAQRALGRRQRSRDELAATLMELVERTTRRLRAAARTCRTIVLRLRFLDFERVTRSRTMPEPTSHTAPILETAAGLLRDAEPLIAARGLTLLGIALTNLADATGQLPLPLDRARAIDSTVDKVRDRFGTAAIKRGTLVGHESGPTVPLLPD
jgi:DNA polymerase-4